LVVRVFVKRIIYCRLQDAPDKLNVILS